MAVGEWFQLMAGVGSLGCVVAIIIYALVKILNGHIAWVAFSAMVLGAAATGSKLTMSGGSDGWKVDLAELRATIETQKKEIASLRGEASDLRKQVASLDSPDYSALASETSAIVEKLLRPKIENLEEGYNAQGLALAKADAQREELFKTIQEWAGGVEVGPGKAIIAKDTKAVEDALQAFKATDYKTFWEEDPTSPTGWKLIPYGKDSKPQNQQ